MSNLYNDSASAVSGEPAKSILTAFFDSRSEAEDAVERLKEAGIPDVRLMPGYEADAEKANVDSDDRGGFWPQLEDWLLPDDDRAVYAEGLRRGGFLVSASVDEATYDTAHDILDDEGAIDMDERADLWRSEGWNVLKQNETYREARYDQNRLGEADRDQQVSASRDDVFEADAAESATGAGHYMRSGGSTPSRVRAYELDQEVPMDEHLRDDILPTGHQRTVAEGQDPDDRERRQSQEMDGLRQEQSFPRSR
ncbi:hypothetical protein SAMN02927900_03414 [Rhizobium mongolense subsp. loessense]|uniref:Heat induced stress protein YflT n=1 Tax=Rhizobium mongolense subsp. loessense TaxID=158890 RepID=A0A1G4S469_9HYPH|nr:hypothetical protein [Rhizobium mongolense]SCW63993.1 hypothetical protein SAMN02927900_03414 [Rhizobium mongolense subsp. loessense]